MEVIAGVALSLMALVVLAGMVFTIANVFVPQKVTKAVRIAVTLKHNEGAFVALRVEKYWDRWVFEDVKIIPAMPNQAVAEAAPGRLHVPKRNILYYQEIENAAQ